MGIFPRVGWRQGDKRSCEKVGYHIIWPGSGRVGFWPSCEAIYCSETVCEANWLGSDTNMKSKAMDSTGLLKCINEHSHKMKNLSSNLTNFLPWKHHPSFRNPSYGTGNRCCSSRDRSPGESKCSRRQWWHTSAWQPLADSSSQTRSPSCDCWLPWKFCLSGCCLDTDLCNRYLGSDLVTWEIPMERSHIPPGGGVMWEPSMGTKSHFFFETPFYFQSVHIHSTNWCEGWVLRLLL
jgi:hypothetical protein